MTDKQLYMLFGEAVCYNEPEAFASDAAISCLDPEEPEQEIDMQLYEQMLILWHIACDPFKDFLALLGLSQTKCSERFCIPLRTVQGWVGEQRTSPPYIRLMMAEVMGILKIRA